MATYSFSDVQATLVSPVGIIDLGYGNAVAEEGISIDMAGNKNTMLVGADGEGMHSLHSDKSGSITVRFLKTSPANTKLQAIYDAQTLVSAFHGLNTIVIRNSISGDVTTARSCAFTKKPALNYQNSGDFVEWSWDSIKIDTILGDY